MDRFTEYADFNEQQLGWINTMANSYHTWHRTSQLPRYASFMREVEAGISNSDPIPHARAKSWVDAALGFSVAVERCNPLNNAFTLLGSLSDEQVIEIQEELEHTYQDYIKELERRDPGQRRALRFKKISKWLGRTGLRLNDEQQVLLRDTIARHRDFQRDGLDLWRSWNDSFIVLLQQREAADFTERMALHLAGLWNLSKDNYPQEWHANYELWVDFFHQLLDLQTDQQRAGFSHWLLAMANTLDGLAESGDAELMAATSVEYAYCADASWKMAVNRELSSRRSTSNGRPANPR